MKPLTESDITIEVVNDPAERAFLYRASVARTYSYSLSEREVATRALPYEHMAHIKSKLKADLLRSIYPMGEPESALALHVLTTLRESLLHSDGFMASDASRYGGHNYTAVAFWLSERLRSVVKWDEAHQCFTGRIFPPAPKKDAAAPVTTASAPL